MTIIDFATSNYSIRTARSYPPGSLAQYRERAALHDSFAMDDNEAEYLFVGVTRIDMPWPILVVEQRFQSCQQIFNPGVLAVPDAHTIFIGAGTRLLAYSLEATPRRLWEEQTECGFFSWQVHGGVVLMSAELELAAYSVKGAKLWSSFVEPPWSFTVKADEVELEVMGDYTRFTLSGGPRIAP